MFRVLIALLVALATLATLVTPLAAEARDPRVPRQFQRLHPCPSTGLRYGYCPGYIRDHIIPLCKGGADTVLNMQWQTTKAAAAKDRVECKR